METQHIPVDLQSQLETLFDAVWRQERQWRTEDRIDLAVRVGASENQVVTNITGQQCRASLSVPAAAGDGRAQQAAKPRIAAQPLTGDRHGSDQG